LKSDIVTLSIPSKNDYILPVRLMMSGIASRIGFSVDQIEEIKTLVAEACTLMLGNGDRGSIGIHIEMSDGLKIVIQYDGDKIIPEEQEESQLTAELSQLIIRSLCENAEFIYDAEYLSRIELNIGENER